jgi:hypothetical protein
MWFAIPSSQWTLTTYSLPVSRRTPTVSGALLGRRQGGLDDHARFVGVGVEQAVAVGPAAAYRVRIDFKPDGWIDRDIVDAIIADNVKAELTFS